MPVLRGKNILLISPQAWDKVKVSKHHYAISLAKMGNNVYFLNPPSDKGVKKFNVLDTEFEFLKIIQYKISFPVWFRFKFKWLYNRLMKFQVNWLRKKFPFKPDIIWSFEPNLYHDLRLFGGTFHIFHPVDVFHQESAMSVASTADIIFSVSPSILEKFKSIQVSKYFINHGLGHEFEQNARRILEDDEFKECKRERKTIGYIGNLLIKFIDRELFISIIERHAELDFLLIGPYEDNQSSLGGADCDAIRFVGNLKKFPNVQLLGPKSSSELIPIMNNCDAFIICYTDTNREYDLSNSHKILEYLSTGKPVISTPIFAYKGQTDLITMPENNSKSSDYKSFFEESFFKIDELSSKILWKKRIELALDNTYKCQIDKIETLIYSYFKIP